MEYVILPFPPDNFQAKTFSKFPEKPFGLPKTQSDMMDVPAVCPLTAAAQSSFWAKGLTKSYFRVQSEPWRYHSSRHKIVPSYFMPTDLWDEIPSTHKASH